MRAVSVPTTRIGRLSGMQSTQRCPFFPSTAQLLLVVDQLRVALVQDGALEPVVWSVGCGAGEELYGVGIAAVEELGAVARYLRLVGSDPDARLVARAHHGIYDSTSTRGLSSAVLDRYFQALGEDHWAVLPHTLRPVEFHARRASEVGDVLSPESALAVIHRARHCPLEARELDAIVDRIAPGGLLVLEAADGVPHHPRLEPDRAEVPGVFVKRPLRRPPVPTRQTPLRVLSDSSASTLPPPPRLVDVQLLLRDATSLGRQGRVEAAFLLVDEALRLDPNGPQGYLVRAQLNLAAGSIEVALDDLRRLLFLAPSCRLARYWYALALRSDRHPRQALAQIRELERQLERVDCSERLEDDVTTVAELQIELATLTEQLTTQTDGERR